MMKFIVFLFGLGYLVMVGLRYMRIFNGRGQPEVSHEAEKRQREKRFHEVLGIQGKVTGEQIKKAYRRRIAEYHPDKVQNMAPEIRKLAEQRTAELTEAYAYLKEKHRIV
jgi:preprotein translocase subunit Sec63